MIRYSGDRFLNIELVTNIKTGLKIPLSSIVKKNFYVIPKEYMAKDEDNGDAGFYRKVTRRGKTIPLNLSVQPFTRKMMITTMWIQILSRTEM